MAAAASGSNRGGILRRFRLNGTRPAKTLTTTIADIAGDWWFYLSIRNIGDGGDTSYDKYQFPLMAFAIVSAVMGVIMVVSIYWNKKCQQANCKENSKYVKFGKCLKTVLGLEILVEDIPQFVLTSMISIQQSGEITPEAVFNLTTSGMNFVLNLLDMVEIENDDDDDNNNNDNNRSSYVSYAS